MYEQIRKRCERYGITVEQLANLLCAISVDNMDDNFLWHTFAAANGFVDQTIKEQRVKNVEVAA